MNTIITSYLKSPSGELLLGSLGEKLCLCDWRYRTMRQSIDNRIKKGVNAVYSDGQSDVINAAKQQLADYFEGRRRSFTLQLLMIGTPFQQRVWNELLKIPCGKTLSYLQLAENLGNKKAVRAVASANGANGISIFIPCHRIIGSNGDLVGYAGGLEAKKKLLALENSLVFRKDSQ